MTAAVQDHPLTLKLAHQANLLSRDHTALVTAQAHVTLLLERHDELGLTHSEITDALRLEALLMDAHDLHAGLLASLNSRKESA